MKRVFLVTIVPALLVAMGIAQTPVASGNTDQITVKGCLGSLDSNHTLAEDNTGKTFQITERQALAFAWQNFNALNNVNRGLPVNDLTSSNVGAFTSLETFAVPRTMQFSLRYTF